MSNLAEAKADFERYRRIFFQQPSPETGRLLKLFQGRYKRARAEARKLTTTPKELPHAGAPDSVAHP